MQEPTIDSLSDEGVTPDIGAAEDISFNDVHFSYPSRENIPVNLCYQRNSSVVYI